jgi:hypothetical protein
LSLHRSFLKSATNRKRDEDIEIRRSLRATNIGVSPDDAFRPSMSMRGSNFRASIRKSMGNYNDPAVVINSNENRDSITIPPGSKSFNTTHDQTVTNPMVDHNNNSDSTKDEDM